MKNDAVLVKGLASRGHTIHFTNACAWISKRICTCREGLSRWILASIRTILKDFVNLYKCELYLKLPLAHHHNTRSLLVYAPYHVQYWSFQHLSNVLLAVKEVLFVVGTSKKCALQSFHQSQWRPLQIPYVAKYSGYNLQIEISWTPTLAL